MSGVPGDPENYTPVLPSILDDPIVQAFIAAARPPSKAKAFKVVYVTRRRHWPRDLETLPGLERATP